MSGFDNVCPLVRNHKGRVVKPAPFQSSVKSGEVARVQPNSKWFGEGGREGGGAYSAINR